MHQFCCLFTGSLFKEELNTKMWTWFLNQEWILCRSTCLEAWLFIHLSVLSDHHYRIHMSRVRLEVAKQSFTYAGAKLWNELPNVLRSTISYIEFKKLLKHIILVCILINCFLWSEPPIHLVTYGPLTNDFTYVCCFKVFSLRWTNCDIFEIANFYKCFSGFNFFACLLS